jgi:hypothetical protein
MPHASIPDGSFSAEIIPFPRRPEITPQPPPIAAEDPGDRLRRALAMLEAAQAEQRRALSSWRDAITALSSSASGLNRSLETYQASLSRLQEG